MTQAIFVVARWNIDIAAPNDLALLAHLPLWAIKLDDKSVFTVAGFLIEEYVPAIPIHFAKLQQR